MARGTVTMNPLSDAINPPEEAEAEREPGQGAFAEVVANSLRERVKQRDLTVSGSAVSQPLTMPRSLVAYTPWARLTWLYGCASIGS